MKQSIQGNLDIVNTILHADYMHEKRLGGLSNVNYLCRDANRSDEPFVIKVEGEAMSELQLKNNLEGIMSGMLSEQGLAPKAVDFRSSTEHTVKATHYIENSRSLTSADMLNPDIQSQISNIFKVIHNGTLKSDVIFDVFAISKQYYTAFLHGQTNTKYHAINHETLSADIRTYCSKHTRNEYKDLQECYDTNHGMSLCHNDTYYENFIVDDKGKVMLLDFEYSAMNLMEFDYAAMFLEADFNQIEQEQFYKIHNVSEGAKRVVELVKPLLDHIWSTWAFVKYLSGGCTDESMKQYGLMRYDRAIKALKTL